jgi:hypothetical protein
MDTLKSKLQTAVSEYAGKVFNGSSYLTQSEDATVFTVVIVARIKGEHISNVSLVARIADDMIIIERDQNDKPLVDALVQAGIPREKIILAYAGEPVPDAIL